MNDGEDPPPIGPVEWKATIAWVELALGAFLLSLLACLRVVVGIGWEAFGIGGFGLVAIGSGVWTWFVAKRLRAQRAAIPATAESRKWDARYWASSAKTRLSYARTHIPFGILQLAAGVVFFFVRWGSILAPFLVLLGAFEAGVGAFLLVSSRRRSRLAASLEAPPEESR